MYLEQTIADLTQKVQRYTAAIGVLQEMAMGAGEARTTTPAPEREVKTDRVKREKAPARKDAAPGGFGKTVLETAKRVTAPFGPKEVHRALRDRAVKVNSVRDALNYAVKMGKLNRIGPGEYNFDLEGRSQEPGPVEKDKAELREKLQQAIEDRDAAKRHGREPMATILTSKVEKLQAELDAL